MKAGWETKTLSELCIVDWGNTDLTKASYVEAGEYLAVSAAGCDGRIGHKEHSKYTPVLSAIGAQCGRMFFPEEDFTAIKNTITLTPREGVCTGKFLYQLLSYVDLPKRGSAQPFISKGDIQSFQVTIPASLPEQQRIVAILDEAFAGIAMARTAAEHSRQNARALFQSGYIEVFQRVVVNSYRPTTVAEVAHPSKGSMRTGPFGSQLLHSEFVDDGVAVLGIDNAVNNEFRWDKRRYISQEKYSELSRYRVNPGDVIITIMGTCGRCAIVPDDIPLAINTKHLCCITLDPNKCIPEFLHGYFLYHPTAQKFLTAQAKGSIMAGLNMGIISALPVLLPSLAQQQEIADKIGVLREETQLLEALYQRKIKALDELKQSLLHQVFSGNL